MSGAENVESGDRQDRLDKDFQRSSADQSGIVFGIVVQVERQGLGLFRLHDLAGRLPHFGFYAAAANRTQNGTIIAHQHLGRFKRGNRSPDIDDGGQRSLASFAPQPDYLFVNVHGNIVA